tara:strand:+ start:4830 stop:5762 length:933 start_codon:yes stop_codon:yes gene_type:complete
LNKIIKFLIKIIILISSVYLINNLVDFKDLEVKIINYRYLYLTLAIGFLSFFLSGLRWSILLEKFIQPQKLSKLLYIQSIHALSCNFIPGILNEGVRIYFSKLVNMNVSDSATVIVVDRFFGMLSKGFFIGISILFCSYYFLERSYFYLIFILIIIFYFLCIFFLKKIWQFVSNILRYIKESKIKEFLRKGYHFISIFSENKKETILPLFLSIFIHFLQIISFYFISKSLFNNISIIPVIILVPTITLISTLPITFNGWGVRELLFIYFFKFFNYSEEITLLTSILFGLTSAVIPLIVLLIFYSFKFIKK